jgi:precorrin-6A/cobalt-precorrin-6A reductase
MKLLILGGTTEANILAGRLKDDARFGVCLSLAGRTVSPRLPPVTTRSGGFGGVAGLTDYLREEAIDVLIDATHPFAVRISANAQIAAERVGIPLIVVTRPAWQPEAGDRWTIVPSLEAAAAALPETRSCVFLTVGRQSLAPFASRPQHHYVIRVIDPPEIPEAMENFEIVVGRGPFPIDDEIAILRAHRVDVLVTKNSGGEAAHAKLAAARTLGLPVVLVDRPVASPAPRFLTIEAVLEELTRLHGRLTNRSV